MAGNDAQDGDDDSSGYEDVDSDEDDELLEDSVTQDGQTTGNEESKEPVPKNVSAKQKKSGSKIKK